MSRYYDSQARGALLTLPPPPLAASWAQPQRFKPERARQHKLPWKGDWLACPDTVGSMTIADVSPRFAVKRIVLLYENAQYREAANFINRLSHGTFKTILGQLPIDLFIEAMPHSVSILEALYAKVFLSSDCGVKVLRPDSVLGQIVKLFCTGGSAERWLPSARKLLKVIVLSEPKLKKGLQVRRRCLDKAVEGLGQHGLVGTSDEALASLHDALRVEFRKLVDTYKTALSKLDELSLAGKTDLAAPVQISHQRQLSLRQGDIQERLIKNKSLLNVVEPAMGSRSLEVLLAILQRRVDCDKEALFQFTQLKKELKNDNEAVVAPLLMTYSHACDQVLEMMKEVGEEEEDDSSDISGYHSDSDSAIMMSGNSPYVSKRARHNFISRSVRCGSQRSSRTSVVRDSSPSTGPLTPINRHPANSCCTTSAGSEWGEWSPRKDVGSIVSREPLAARDSIASRDTIASRPWCHSCHDRAIAQHSPVSQVYGVEHRGEVASLQTELEQSRAQLETTRAQLDQTRAQLDQTRTQLDQARARLDHNSPEAKEVSCQRLVRCYANLYAQGRADALQALDALPALNDAPHLKSKILFSVIVLSWRCAGSYLSGKKEQVRRALLAGAAQGTAHQEAEQAIAAFLRRTIDTYDLARPIEDVSSQLWATLYDYPCLKGCQGLVQYIKDCVRLAWALVNQSPALELEFEERKFRRELHVRWHQADQESETITTYLWPALCQGKGGPALHKAVVVT